jgi:hypothetical protein
MQSITSAKTSLKQVPALFKRWANRIGPINLDIGGGAYDDGTNFLYRRGVKSVVYDPYNRSLFHNAAVLKAMELNRPNSATLANVLNVIKESGSRAEVIRLAYSRSLPKATLFVSIYEGDRSGRSRITSKGWQEHRAAATYIKEIEAVGFKLERKRGNLMEFVK